MSERLRVYLVEDEPLARGELKYLLKRAGQVEIVGEAEAMPEALEDIRQLQPEAVFLDIHLSQGNGLDLARELNNLEKPPAVVFATAYDEHALKAFDLNAFDYILKPFDEERLKQALDKISKRVSLPPAVPVELQGGLRPLSLSSERVGKLAVTVNERIFLVDLERIVYVGYEEKQVVVKMVDGAHRMMATLAELERKLGAAPFLRVHRGYIVNLNHVTELQPWFNGTYTLLCKDGSKIPVSRTYMKDLKHAFGL